MLHSKATHYFITLLLILILVCFSCEIYPANAAHPTYYPGYTGSELSILTAVKNNVYVAWQNESGDYDIFIKRSSDNGTTFEKTINISNNTSVSFGPQMAFSGNNVYIAWSDQTWKYNSSVGAELPSYSHILFKRSTDNGHSFSKPIILDQNFSFLQSSISIAVVDNYVYVVWDMEPSNPYQVPDFQIYFAKSSDYGATFSPAVDIGSSLPNGSYEPQLAAFGSNVYVTWFNIYTPQCDLEQYKPICTQGVLFRKSSDHGSTFDNAISFPNTAGVQHPRMAVSSDGKDVYVVWGPTRSTDAKIHTGIIERSADGGSTFGTPINVPDTNPPLNITSPVWSPGRQTPPDYTFAFPASIYVPVDKPNEVYVVVGSIASFNYQNITTLPMLSSAYIAKSLDYGHSFGSLNPIISNSSYVYNSLSYRQLLIDSNGTIYATWISNSTAVDSTGFYHNSRNANASSAGGNGYNLFFKEQNFSSGNTSQLEGNKVINLSKDITPFPNEEKPTPLSGTGPPRPHILVTTPLIAVSDSNVYVAWQTSNRNGQNIFFTRVTDSGHSNANTTNLASDSKLEVVPEFPIVYEIMVMPIAVIVLFRYIRSRLA